MTAARLETRSAYPIGESAILRASCDPVLYDALPAIGHKINQFVISYVIESLRLQLQLHAIGKPCLSWESLRVDPRLGTQTRSALAQVGAAMVLQTLSDVESTLARISQCYVTRNLVPTYNTLGPKLQSSDAPMCLADLEAMERTLAKAKAALDPMPRERPRWAMNATADVQGYADAMFAEDNEPRIKTPWRTINALSNGGVQRGDIMGIASGSGGAKSTLATYFAMYAYQAGHNVVCWNGENRPSLQRRREALALTGMSRVEARRDPQAFAEALRQARTIAQRGSYKCLDVLDPSYADTPWSMARIDAMLGGAKVDMFVLDYIMLLSPSLEMQSKATKVERAAAILEDVKRFTRKRNCFTLLLSQLNKDGDFSWNSELMHPLTYRLQWTLDQTVASTKVDILKCRDREHYLPEDVNPKSFWINTSLIDRGQMPEMPESEVPEEIRDADPPKKARK